MTKMVSLSTTSISIQLPLILFASILAEKGEAIDTTFSGKSIRS